MAQHDAGHMRELALRARKAAEIEPLANARQKFIDAANTWDRLARQSERLGRTGCDADGPSSD